MKSCLLAVAAFVIFATSAVAEKKIKPTEDQDVVISTQSIQELDAASSGGNVLVGLLLLLTVLALSGGGGNSGSECYPYCAE